MLLFFQVNLALQLGLVKHTNEILETSSAVFMSAYYLLFLPVTELALNK